MPRRRAAFLSRHPLLDTDNPTLAQATTARFWPRHEAEILGPDDYSLQMNRVELARTALTYVSCTTRIRVRPAEACADYTFYLPLRGGIEIVADGYSLVASPHRVLLRAPARVVRFEASPIECLIVDLPAESLRAAVGEVAMPRHLSLLEGDSTALSRLVMRLARGTERWQIPAGWQELPAAARAGRLPPAIARLENAVLTGIAVTAGGGLATGDDPRERCDVGAVKRWLARHAAEDVRLSELGRQFGVSPRAIQRSFLRTGCTPHDYLRSVRLDRANRLLVAAGRNATVAGIAKAVGFTHLGRFSQVYRERFGELPSATLARIRSRRG